MNKLIIIFLLFFSSNLSIAQDSSYVIVKDEIEGKGKVESILYNELIYYPGDTILLDSEKGTDLQFLVIKIDNKSYRCDLNYVNRIACIIYEITIIRKKWIKKSKYSYILLLCDGRNILGGLPLLE